MVMISIDTTEIQDWPSFHRVFSMKLGFPGFYGNNMDAFIDCLGYIDDPSAGMTTVHIPEGQTLAIQLDEVESFKKRCPDQFEALLDACAFVNWGRTSWNTAPLIALSYYC